MQFRFDEEANAPYIAISVGDVVRTIEVTDMVSIDVDAYGAPLGTGPQSSLGRSTQMPPLAAERSAASSTACTRTASSKVTEASRPSWIA